MAAGFQRRAGCIRAPTPMLSVEIGPVAGRRELEAFVALPYALHRNDPCFTPPLRRDVRAQLDASRNPFFGHAARELFLARREGRAYEPASVLLERIKKERKKAEEKDPEAPSKGQCHTCPQE